MAGMLSGYMVSYIYIVTCLLLAVLTEYFPWRFLFSGMTQAPALDLAVIAFIALYVRRGAFMMTLVVIGLLKDLYAGTPPGMHVAIYLCAFAIGRFFSVSARSMSVISRVFRGVVVAALACFPELAIRGIIENMLPSGGDMITRTLLTATCFPFIYLILLPVYGAGRPMSGGPRYFRV